MQLFYWLLPIKQLHFILYHIEGYKKRYERDITNVILYLGFLNSNEGKRECFYPVIFISVLQLRASIFNTEEYLLFSFYCSRVASFHFHRARARGRLSYGWRRMIKLNEKRK